ncbi:hypothetical protein BJV78DRAFT_735311 [Lactifluus subvellereus]|nr:hypothetical protein BJV78DRAFT_735311 [Lactifluus subvellereus]
MPVCLALGDISSFRKHVKYIGRAYQKRSVAMIQLCRLFLEISPGKPDQIDALRSLFETVENALKSAVDAGKERCEATDIAFAAAEEHLDRYAAWYHPEQESVLGDVQDIIEDAAQKDSYIMKTHRRLSTRLGLNKTDTSPPRSLVKVHFQILDSPTNRREAPIVTCELGPEVQISELLWTFSRMPEDRRISLKQNPHFYFSKDLSDRAPAYGDEFRLEPLKDLRPEKGLVVLVLLDRAGQIFFDYQKFSKTYGNIWRPSNTIILKDLQGTLEAASRISPRIASEVCIWQRGGYRPEQDLTKWTEVLDRALDLPDVDWLIRSETSPDEAFDIEVTGGWERCSPVKTPDHPPVFAQDYPPTTSPPPEDAHIAAKDPPTPVSGLTSFVPIVASSDQVSSHSSEDAPPSKDTVDVAVDEAHSNTEEFRPPVEDVSPLAPDILLPLESTPQLEAIVDPLVQLAPASPEPLTLPAENGRSPTTSTSIPDTVTPMARENIHPQVDPLHATARSSPEPLILHPGSNVAPAGSSELAPHGDTSPSDHVRLQAEAVHPAEQPACATPESSTPPSCKKSGPTSSPPSPDNIHQISSLRPHDEVIHAPAHLACTLSERLAPHTENDIGPAGGAPIPSITTPPLDSTRQAEAVHSPIHTLPTSRAPATSVLNPDTLDPASGVTHPQFETVHPPVQSAPIPPGPLLPPIGGKPALMSGVLAPDSIPSSSGFSLSQVGVVRPLVQSPRAPEALTLPLGKCPQVETGHPWVQISRTLPEPSAPSIVESGVPSSHTNPPPTCAPPQVETSRPPIQLARSSPGPRTPSFCNKMALENGVSSPDPKDHSSSRPRIKSHPKRMTTPVGQRRPTGLPGQMVSLLAVQPVRQVEQSVTSLAKSSNNVVPVTRQDRISESLHRTSIGKPSGLATIPETRGESKSLASGQPTATASPEASFGGAIPISTSTVSSGSSQGSSVITQVPPRQSRQPTVPLKQMVPQLTVQPSDQPMTRPVEQPLTNLEPNRNNPAPITRQDRVTGASLHSPLANPPSLAMIPEVQDSLKSCTAGLATAPLTLATTEQVGSAIAISPSVLSDRTRHMSSMTGIKDSAGQSRQSTILPEQPASQLTVRPRYQSMIRLPEQYATSPALKRSDAADPAAIARRGRTTEVLSYNSRAEIPGVAAALEIQGDYKGQSLRSRAPPTQIDGTATISSLSAWNSTSRISSRIKTKDLINRHKPQNGSDARPLAIMQSLGTHSPFKVPTSGASQAPLASKPDANRVDSGVELWDYDPHRDIQDRMSALDTSANRHSNPPLDCGSASALPSNRFAASSNANSEDGTSSSLPLKESRSSISGYQKPQLVTAGSPSTDPPSGTPPGRREPFINRKPQPTSQTTIQGGVTTQPEYSTPPRPSTPSSMSHSASVTASTQTTLMTPATSFSIPSREPSPPLKAAHRSWFRRNVIEPVKATLGYDS